MNGLQSQAAVRDDGTVLLGQNVCCDGYVYGRDVRVQTHIHHDHMRDFNKSKWQDMLMSPATRDLLIAILDEDIPYRSNIHILENGGVFSIGDETIELADNGHMLGSVQVRVTTADGHRVGYSSDFYWPAPTVLKLDSLVIDATYGSPDAIREYSQHEVEEQFVELVASHARSKAIVVCGFRGRLQHAMSLLTPVLACPIVVSDRVDRLIGVYEKYGHHIGEHVTTASAVEDGVIGRDTPFVAFVELTELRTLPWAREYASVTLSAYMVPRSDPILDYGNGDFRVALTDHADFIGTLEYVKATGANRVFVYPTAGQPDALVEAIRRELSLETSLCPVIQKKGWG